MVVKVTYMLFYFYKLKYISVIDLYLDRLPKSKFNFEGNLEVTIT